MVNFTCNHCGESLQKPRVEKHYQSTACGRSGISVTCMDCLKDFKLQEFAAHIKCISEAERYSAKGSVHAVKKGDAKQSSWVATVNSIIEEQVNAKPSVKSLLEMISKHSNIPRKKNKFVNFITSMSGGRVNAGDITEVWGLLEVQKNAAKEEAMKLVATKTEVKSNKQKSDDGTQDVSADTEETPATKNAAVNGDSKKKQKRKVQETSEGNDGSPQKKKKSENGEAAVANGVNNNMKGNKKGNNKHVKANGVAAVVNGALNSKKFKKKGDQEENKDSSNEFKKSKQNKPKEEVVHGTGFGWKAAITEVTKATPGGIPKDTLKAKVFKMYEAANGKIENAGAIAKTYFKKIKKIKDIKIENDIVTCIE